MFLDKHFKENKDKGSLYGAICSIQPLIQLNIFVASQRAYCDLPGLHRRMLYPFKVTPGCIPVFPPGEDHGKKLQLSHHPSLGSLCWGCCSNPDLKHAERIFYSWVSHSALVLDPVSCYNTSGGIADTAWGDTHSSQHSKEHGVKSTQRKSCLLSHTSPLPPISLSNNSDVLALPDKNWSLKLKCHLLVKKLSYVFHSWERTHLCL